MAAGANALAAGSGAKWYAEIGGRSKPSELIINTARPHASTAGTYVLAVVVHTCYCRNVLARWYQCCSSHVMGMYAYETCLNSL